MFAVPSNSMLRLDAAGFNSLVGESAAWWEELAAAKCPRASIQEELDCMSAITAADRLDAIERHLGGSTYISSIDRIQEWRRSISKLLASELRSAPAKADSEKVAARFKYWKDVVKTSSFAIWLQSQSEETKTLARSSNPEDAVRLLSLFGRRNDESGTNGDNTAAISRRYPNWKEVVKTPAFHAWFNAQEDRVKVLARSQNSDDAIELLTLYFRSRQQ